MLSILTGPFQRKTKKISANRMYKREFPLSGTESKTLNKRNGVAESSSLTNAVTFLYYVI